MAVEMVHDGHDDIMDIAHKMTFDDGAHKLGCFLFDDDRDQEIVLRISFDQLSIPRKYNVLLFDSLLLLIGNNCTHYRSIVLHIIVTTSSIYPSIKNTPSSVNVQLLVFIHGHPLLVHFKYLPYFVTIDSMPLINILLRRLGNIWQTQWSSNHIQ